MAKTVHSLLEVFDELATQCTFEPLNSFLITVLVEREDTFKYFKHYVREILFNDATIRRIIPTEVNGVEERYLLKQYRIRVVKHFRVSVTALLDLFGHYRHIPLTGMFGNDSPKDGGFITRCCIS